MIDSGLAWAWLAWASVLEPTPAPPDGRLVDVIREVIRVTERGPVSRADSGSAVSVLDSATLASLPVANLAEALRYTPAVDVLFPSATGGVPMSSARGFFGGGEAEYLQLRIDGVAVSDAESGIADWRALRAGEIERIEVLRGPGSALYGDTALGGVVDVTTRKPNSRSADAELEGGSFGSAFAAAGGRLGTIDARVAIDVRVASERSDGFRAHSALENHRLALRLDSSPTDRPEGAEPAEGASSWRAGLSGSEQRREDPGPLDPAEFATDPGNSNARYDDDRERIDRARAWFAREAIVEGVANLASWSLRLDADRRASDFVRTLLLAPDFGDRLRRELTSRGFGGSVEFAAGSADSAAVEVHGGLEARHDDLDVAYFGSGGGNSDVSVASVEARRQRFATFGALSWSPTERVRLGASARADWIGDDAGGATSSSEALSPRIALSWRPFHSASTTVFANAGRAFKAPTLDQRYDPRPFPDGTGGSFELSNPALAPQRARSFETGLWHSGRMGEAELTLYRTDVDDEIDFDPNTFRYVNLLRSRHQGIEAAWRGRLGRDQRWQPFLSASLTEVETRDSAESTGQLKNVPRERARLGLSAVLGRGVTATVTGVHLGERWLDDAHQFALPSVELLDLRLALDRPRWRIWTDVTNALDESWVPVGYALTGFDGATVPYVFPAPGRTVRVGISLRTG